MAKAKRTPPGADDQADGLDAPLIGDQQQDGTDGAEGAAGSAQRPRNCPEERANWLSHLTFWYVNGLVRAGSLGPLQPDDLWDVAKWDEAGDVYKKFEAAMRASATPDAPQGSIYVALRRRHWWTMTWTGLLKVFHDVAQFLPAYLLERLLNHMAVGGGARGALFWASALLATSIFEAITINFYFHALFRLSLHVKTELIQALYAKSLRITGAVKTMTGVGAIVNLQSNDASKLWNAPLYLHIIWNGPFQILVVMGMLVRLMGWAPAMAGLGVTVIMIPLTAVAGKAMARVRRNMVAQTDARVKLASEVITGMKAIKLMAWEDPYVERINALRDKELKAIRSTQLLGTFNMALFSSGPVLVALAAFGVHVWMGASLTAAIAFPALSLFNLLRFPIIVFPSQIMNYIHARVGLQRIQKFMQAEETAGRGAVPPALRPPPSFAPPAPSLSGDLTSPLLSKAASQNGAAPGAEDGPPLVGAEPPLPDLPPGITAKLTRGTFAWEPDQGAVLHALDLAVPTGKLIMVVGQVGSGKSSLLAALLGEMHRVSGTVQINGKVAYTAQDPWIQNATLRDNILMGAPLEEGRYIDALAACALAPDLEMLPAADATEIGEKGLNLSGGQKHRVALARAAYTGADVYLLDDPLSAVDAHVGRHIFRHAICGLLGGATRVVVTHQLQYLPSADLIVVMAGGEIRHTGTYTELVAKGVDLDQIVKHRAESESERGSVRSSSERGRSLRGSTDGGSGVRRSIDRAGSVRRSSDGGARAAVSLGASRQASAAGVLPATDEVDEAALVPAPPPGVDEGSSDPEDDDEGSGDPLEAARDALRRNLALTHGDGTIVKVEGRAVGQVKAAIYGAYLSAWSGLWGLLPLVIVVLAFSERGLQVGQNFTLSLWTNDNAAAAAEHRKPHTRLWLTLYFALGLSSIGAQTLRALTTIAGSIAASRRLHARLLAKLMRLPMSFYDSQPTGRLLNRLTKDTELVDIQVSMSVNSALSCLVSALLSIVVVAGVTPVALAALLPLTLLYYRIQTLYIATSRELKRLDAVAFSPIFSHFGETLAGLTTIRAFDRQGHFYAQNLSDLNRSNRAYWPIQVVNRWLSVRLEMMGSSIVFATAVSVTVLFPASAGLVGLAISSALNLTGIMNWGVRQLTDLEVNMNSVERMVEYES